MGALRSRLALTFAATALCLGLAAAARPADEPGFMPIFNGKDLTGWEGDPSHWSVKDGAITGVTSKDHPLTYNKFLIWRGGKPKNFELKTSFRLIGNNNSGVQYRSHELPKVGPYSVGGYQADIHPLPNYCGMLYEERGRGIVALGGQKVVLTPSGEKRLVGKTDPVTPTKLDDWNELTIVAKGNHLVHTLNGRTTVDIIDHEDAKRSLEGLIALQVHAGPPMTVQFRSIELKTLPDGGLIAPGDTPAAKEKEAAAPAKPATKKRQIASGPAPEATSIARLKTLKGFKVELVHTVNRDTEGSWVSMTIDPKGRLIVSDQYGKLYRVTPSKPGGSPSETKVETIDVPTGGAHGLLWAFDSLYVMNNEGQGGSGKRGLYRVRDTNGDDSLDKVELLREIAGGGEHGSHAIVLSPDGKSLYIVAGNATRLPELTSSRVPLIWGEDNVLAHMVDGAGFMTNEKAPGGWVCKTDPDGKTLELISMGYRNAYDMAFNLDGELFTYDSDMEWDMSLPWYRPTRVCQVVSGSDYGYRNGSGKWPTYYPDSLPPVTDIGPGSPTGVAFGYGTKFPTKYQRAFFICDWSYGKLYALHLSSRGAGYSADVEEFITGTPLPLTDMVVNPNDGALYFAIGGRRTSSGLYRVVYDGPESNTPDGLSPETNMVRDTRRQMEWFHGRKDPEAVARAWPNLNHFDRFVRYAARVAIEWQDPETWREKALNESDPAKAVPALLALARVSAIDPAHRRPGGNLPDKALRDRILTALDRAGASLSGDGLLDLLRVYEVVFVRFGLPEPAEAKALAARFSRDFPSKSQAMNRELAQLLVALEAPDAASKVVALLEKAPTQEEQIEYAKDLRLLKTGWTPELHKVFFSWINKAAGYKGGNSFRGFMRQIRTGALASVSESERAELKPLLEAPAPSSVPTIAVAPRPHVKDWTLDELVPVVEKSLHGRDYDSGRSLFAAAACFSCHRFANEGGGAGPDLTGLAGRFTVRDLLESIVVPSKVISDQYGAVIISTTDGDVVTGRIVNLHNDNIAVNTNMLDPNKQTNVDRRKIDEMKPSPISMMPEGLLNTLKRDEVLDLMAYLMSRGDRNSELFRKP
jgi:putative heme-binding domain-containing protein